MSLPDGVTSIRVQTPRLDTHTLVSGPEDGVPVVLVHGNVSSGRFYAELMAQLPASVRAYAPDLRGYGHSEAKGIDGTRGVKDFADDLWAFLDAVGVGNEERPVHLVGWSVGGGVLMQMAIDRPDGIASLTLEAPMSPYGFGGTKGPEGAPTNDAWSGTGGGTANPDFAKRLGEKDMSEDADTSPRNILRSFYVKPPLRFSQEIEDAYTAAMCDTKTGVEFYPGDLNGTETWPAVAPGTTGTNNAISGKYCRLDAFGQIADGPKVLWIRGADDQIVSDTSLFDLGFLGQIGAVPGWPGEDAYPAQPMIAQTRAVLDAYASKGNVVDEVVLPECGHSPHLEHPERFLELLVGQLGL